MSVTEFTRKSIWSKYLKFLQCSILSKIFEFEVFKHFHYCFLSEPDSTVCSS